VSDSRSSKLEEAFRKITRANISRIDDDFIKDYSEKIEIHLKDITNNVDAINNSIDRRNYLVKELGALHEKIEEKNLKFKKDASSMVFLFSLLLYLLIKIRMEKRLKISEKSLKDLKRDAKKLQRF